MGGHDQLKGVKISPQPKNYGSITSGNDTDSKEQSLLCNYVTDPHHWPFHGILLLLLCYIYFASYACVENQSGLENTIIKVMNISTARYSLLFSLFGCPNVIFCLIGGVIVDRVLGHRPSLILVTALTTLGQFLMALGAFLGHFWLMLVGRILIGIGNEMTDIVCIALASKKKNATFRLSVYYTAAKLGGSTSLAVPQYIYNSLRFLSNPHYRLGTTLLVGVGLMIVAMAVTIIIIFMDIQEDKILKKEKRKMSMIRCTDIRKFSLLFWISVLLIGIYCGLIIVYTTVGQGFYTRKYDLTPSASGMANSLVFFSTILVTPFVGYLINLVGRKSCWTTLGMFTAFATHLTLLLSTAQQQFIPYLASIIYSISYAITMPSLYTIPFIITEPNQTATAYGIVHCSYNFVVSVMSYIAGTLIDNAGYFWMEIVFSVLLYYNILMSIVLAFRWNEDVRKSHQIK